MVRRKPLAYHAQVFLGTSPCLVPCFLLRRYFRTGTPYCTYLIECLFLNLSRTGEGQILALNSSLSAIILQDPGHFLPSPPSRQPSPYQKPCFCRSLRVAIPEPMHAFADHCSYGYEHGMFVPATESATTCLPIASTYLLTCCDESGLLLLLHT